MNPNSPSKVNSQWLNVRQKGQTIMMVTVMFLFTGLIIIVGGGTPVLKEAKLVRELGGGKQSLLVAEALEEDVTYRIKYGLPYDTTESLSLAGGAATTTITDNVASGRKEVRTTADTQDFIRKKYMELVRGDSINFNYGVQVGNGGFYMYNSSRVVGNVYANGRVDGANDNEIRGDVVSAGASGLVDDIYATGTVRAHTIQNSTIDKDAYYQSISGTTVRGALYPGSTDPTPASFPISDETLDEWEAEAAESGIYSSPCPYVISTNTTLGPIKINCDLEIRNNPTITLAGMVWVNGNFEVKNSPTIRLDPALGVKSVAVIADNPSNRTTSSKVIVRNATTFQNSGTNGSFVMLVSRNRSAEDGGAETAIDLLQSATGEVLMYSNHGLVNLGNSSNLRELTGYKIEMRNTAELVYKQGLANSLFDTGPGGSWEIYTWHETD